MTGRHTGAVSGAASYPQYAASPESEALRIRTEIFRRGGCAMAGGIPVLEHCTPFQCSSHMCRRQRPAALRQAHSWAAHMWAAQDSARSRLCIVSSRSATHRRAGTLPAGLVRQCASSMKLTCLGRRQRPAARSRLCILSSRSAPHCRAGALPAGLVQHCVPSMGRTQSWVRLDRTREVAIIERVTALSGHGNRLPALLGLSGGRQGQ